MIHGLYRGKNESRSNEVIIKFRSKTQKNIIQQYHHDINGTVIEENSLLGFQVVSSTKPLHEIVNYYKSLKEIEYVRTNYSVHIA